MWQSINSSPDNQIIALLMVLAVILFCYLLIPEKKPKYTKGEIQHQLLKEVLK